MTLSVIVAVADNGVIGRNNALPWHLPADLRHFRERTMGKSMVMGRNTYRSIGRPLPGRHSIVVTQTPDWQEPGVTVARSLAEALQKSESPELVVIGGARLFAEALPQADTLYLSEIHRAYDGDVLFPAWDRSAWEETERQELDGDPPVSFVRLARRQSAP